MAPLRERASVVTGSAADFIPPRPSGDCSMRRLHQKPNAAEVRACNPWLQEGTHVLQPRVVGALGATAAQTLLGKQFRVTQQRGKPVATELAEAVFGTAHPSAVLRARDADRQQAEEEFYRDIRRLAAYLKAGKAKVAGSR